MGRREAAESTVAEGRTAHGRPTCPKCGSPLIVTRDEKGSRAECVGRRCGWLGWSLATGPRGSGRPRCHRCGHYMATQATGPWFRCVRCGAERDPVAPSFTVRRTIPAGPKRAWDGMPIMGCHIPVPVEVILPCPKKKGGGSKSGRRHEKPKKKRVRPFTLV